MLAVVPCTCQSWAYRMTEVDVWNPILVAFRLFSHQAVTHSPRILYLEVINWIAFEMTPWIKRYWIRICRSTDPSLRMGSFEGLDRASDPVGEIGFLLGASLPGCLQANESLASNCRGQQINILFPLLFWILLMKDDDLGARLASPETANSSTTSGFWGRIFGLTIIIHFLVPASRDGIPPLPFTSSFGG